MTYSLNEIEALVKKAARGCGYDWGIAEEAGKAVRWLASHELPGGEVMVAHLQGDGTDGPPGGLDGVWSNAAGLLCPLTSGAALNDCAERLKVGAAQVMDRVAHPLLVVPFAAWAAVHIKSAVTVNWDGVSATTDGFNLVVQGSRDAQVADVADRLSCRIRPDATGMTAPGLRGELAADAHRVLNEFAQRTYAPATEESRLLGAGAGTSDND
ncbi:MAG: DUF3726 domain-containing protein [Pseudomonadota bacterium]